MGNIINKYLAHACFRLDLNHEDYENKSSCETIADLYSGEESKSDIMYNMLIKIENSKDFVDYPFRLETIIIDHYENNENVQFIRIYTYMEDFTKEDYIENGYEIGYGFIKIKVV